MTTPTTRFAIIGTVGVPAKYGGFETLAHQLVLNLRDKFDLTVYSSSLAYSKKERVAKWEGANIVYLPLKANGAQSILYDILSMIHAAFRSDVLLILGVSGCIFLPILKLFTWKKLIVNVDGLEWRRAKWAGWAKSYLIFSEKMAVRYADEIITDNAAIQQYVVEKYGISPRLVEYGGDQVLPVHIPASAFGKYPFLNDEYAFKVCRIEPENNIHLVLEAFARYGEMPLVLMGNWQHSHFGRELKKLYRQYPNLHLLDSIYDPSELNMLRSNCKLYVHGHSAGGTNPSLVEAMHLQLPVLAFDVVYNRVTTQEKALYFTSADHIITTLELLPSLNLSSIAFGLKWVADRRYKWADIAAKYSQLAEKTERTPAPLFDLDFPASFQKLA